MKEYSPIDWGGTVWRYFKTNRLIQSIQNNELYFASANQFTDKFEGAISLIKPDEKDHINLLTSEIDDSYRELKRLTKVSCWNRYDYECDGMWKLYADDNKGVAVVSTPNSLKEGLINYRIRPEYGEEEFIIGNIEYRELEKERASYDDIGRFFNKLKIFQWENELRIIVTLRMAEEYGVNVPDYGINIRFIPQKVIKKIVLGPSISKLDRESIFSVCSSIGIEKCIGESIGNYYPRYIL